MILAQQSQILLLSIRPHFRLLRSWELSSAAFVDDEHLIVASSAEFYGDDDSEEDNRPGKHEIALWRIGSPDYSLTAVLPHPPGTIMPLSARFVLSFYDHPRLIDLQNSDTILKWPNIVSGYSDKQYYLG